MTPQLGMEIEGNWRKEVVAKCMQWYIAPAQWKAKFNFNHYALSFFLLLQFFIRKLETNRFPKLLGIFFFTWCRLHDCTWYCNEEKQIQKYFGEKCAIVRCTDYILYEDYQKSSGNQNLFFVFEFNLKKCQEPLLTLPNMFSFF